MLINPKKNFVSQEGLALRCGRTAEVPDGVADRLVKRGFAAYSDARVAPVADATVKAKADAGVKSAAAKAPARKGKRGLNLDDGFAKIPQVE